MSTDGAGLRRLADAMTEIVWLGGPDGSVEYVNERWREYTGLTLDDLRETPTASVHPDDIARLVELWSGALQTGEVHESEFRLRRAIDGVFRWQRARATAVLDDSGAIAWWFGTIDDIDEEKRLASWQSIVSQASAVLSESLDLQATLDGLLDVVVPELGDWAAIDMLDESDRLRTVAVIHANAEKSHLVERLRGEYTHAVDFERRMSQVLRTRAPQIIKNINDEMIASAASPRLLPTIRELNPRSTVSIPLRRRGRLLGSLVTYWSDSERSYTFDDLVLFEEIGRRAAIAIENARLFERERLVADTFQRAALPSVLPRATGLSFDAVYEPGLDEAQIGGDWYDALRLADGRVLLSIGDVTGSGLEAAVLMAEMRQVVRGTAQTHADPVAMLDAADKTLKSSQPQRIATAVAAVIDPIEMTLAYASAGHPPPILRHANGELDELNAPDLPLGLRLHGDTAACVIPLEPGSMLVFYTDGVIESKRDVLGGIEALHRAAAAVKPGPDAAHRILARALEGVNDDVAVMTVGISEDPGAHVLRWTFDDRNREAAAEARRGIVEALARDGAGDVDRALAELIYSELIANAVRYAPGTIEVAFDRDGPLPVLHVMDRGPGFFFMPRLPSDVLSERGRGLFLVWSFTEDFNVTHRHGGGTHARAVLSIGGLRRV